MEKFTTNNFEESQKVAAEFAQQILRHELGKGALVLALSGDLGAGKTTFLQGFAKSLGIEEVVNSPTFVILKRFTIQDSRFKNFYHLDCYRLENPEDVLHLEFAEIISNPENIVAIEWPEKIEKLLPEDRVKIEFKHVEENKREIVIQ